MNKNIYLLFSLFLLPYSAGFGQSDSLNKRKINSFSIQTGLITERNNTLQVEDFRNLAPSSVLLQTDFTGYNTPNHYKIPKTSGALFSLKIGLNVFEKKQKKNYHFQLNSGVTYFTHVSKLNLYKQDQWTYKTEWDPFWNDSISYDSIVTREFEMFYSGNQLAFDNNLQVLFFPGKRFSINGSLGMVFGMSLNAITYIRYMWSGFSYGGFSYTDTEYKYKHEEFRNKTNYIVSPYLSLQANFRLGKKENFWGNTQLFYEYKFGYHLKFIPELYPVGNYYRFSGLGLRYNLN